MNDPQPNEEQSAAPPLDQTTFVSLIDDHRRLIMKVCWAYTSTPDDRDDLLQDILSQLWASFRNYDRRRPFSTWMYRVALNVAIDSLRRKTRQREQTGVEEMPEFASPRDETRQEQLLELHELLDRQNEADRAILLLFLEGQSYREIGGIIGMTESNVGTRINRLKQTLKKSTKSL
ncbi:MAG: RNA polymerase sigma factor [Planctomycetaceae bacterium]|nr:RNA polymerase sigma factor [Planctomycetaceae bacterium]